MARFEKLFVVAITLLLVGTALIVLKNPTDGYEESARVVVNSQSGSATVGSVNMSDGHIWVCARDIDVRSPDYGSLCLWMGDGEEPVGVERGKAAFSMEIEGVRCEMVFSLDIPHEGSYYYSAWVNGTGPSEDDITLMFMRQTTQIERPWFHIGLSIMTAGLVCLGLGILSMRAARKRNCQASTPL